MLSWQHLQSNLPKDTETWRAKVPGGWLVRVSVRGELYPAESLTFYPDPQHLWDGHSLTDAR